MSDASEKLTRAVRLAIDRHGLLDRGGALIVAVSGGPDSLCLLHVLLSLREEYATTLHVAHLNHGLRGADSDADACFVRETAATWGVSSTLGSADVPALARERKLSVEEAARQARYAFLARVAAQVGADRVALGHNADDQAETVLMHWLRGAGLAGLRGMLPKAPLGELRLQAETATEVATTNEEHATEVVTTNEAVAGVVTTSVVPDVWLIRPLLSVTRPEIEAYCREHALAPRFDLSNLDTTYFRNRLRHELLPYLERYNPNVREVLRRSAQALAGDYEVVRGQAEAAWRRVLRSETGEQVTLNLARWRALPIGLQRSTLRMAVEYLRGNLRDLGWEHIENAVWVARTRETGTQATLPDGLALTVGYDTLRIGDAEASMREAPGCPWFSPVEASAAGADWIELPVPGVTPLPGGVWRIEATYLEMDEHAAWQAADNMDRDTAYLDADRLGLLRMRHRRPGDLFRPLGMGGHSKSVREFMIGEKIPEAWRDTIPLCVTSSPDGEEIVWVVGWRLDDRFKVGPATRHIVRLTVSLRRN